jgi:hypothetical protein
MSSSSSLRSGVIVAYAATVFLSAFLLFQVQPLLSKFILPWFGGTPAVWTSAMLFFQLALFLGYLYAHLTSTFLSSRNRFWVHIIVLGIATVSVAANRLIPPNALRPAGLANESPLLQVMLLLGATVGLPYFALSSTGPLLQKWFSDAFEGLSPYRLFALSNFGSLLALVSYPFFFEVYWGVIAQAFLWSLGFFVFVMCCAACAYHTYANAKSKPVQTVNSTTTLKHDDAPPTYFNLISWLFLPTLACVMFLAVTNEACQNVATVPLLWIVPLAFYLISFIVAFDHPRWYSRVIYVPVTLLLLLWVSNYSSFTDSLSETLNKVFSLTGDNELSLDTHWWLQAAVYFLALLGMAIICHGELAQSKPAPRYLTWFYLTLSLGGAVGGILVNLLAPYLFVTFFEFSLCIGISSLLLLYLILSHCHVLYYKEQTATDGKSKYVVLALLSLVASVTTFYCLGTNVWQESHGSSRKIVHQSRNFYGIVSVKLHAQNDPDEHFTFYSGHVQHGKQFTQVNKRRIPLTYYGKGSGCESAILHMQHQNSACHIGVIGLGTGTIAAYARPADTVRFYEINPEVIEIAQNTEWFNYLSDCPQKPQLILGDARLQLEQELARGENQKFDILCLDAFSGDAIPTHLLTTEAFEIYKQHLKPDGILVLHITNTYLNIFPVAEKLAQQHGFDYRRIYRKGDSDALLYRNDYMLLTKNADFLKNTESDIKDLPDYLQKSRDVPLWTDEYTNLTRLLR